MLPFNALSALLAATLSVQLVNAHGVNHHHKRQAPAPAPAASTSSTSPASTAPASTSTGTPATTGPAPSGTGSYNVPPLSAITMNMPSGPVPSLTTTYTPGAQPTYSNAPPLPSKCTSFFCHILSLLSSEDTSLPSSAQIVHGMSQRYTLLYFSRI